ncbi:MAG: hypothetical protein AB1327_10195 [Bacillota bacterium]|uniref:hypothetical protein n=1 Tax=Desulforudis sp. DRI-14 TaxID=3459793 RepID=UPI003475A51F
MKKNPRRDKQSATPSGGQACRTTHEAIGDYWDYNAAPDPSGSTPFEPNSYPGRGPGGEPIEPRP